MSLNAMFDVIEKTRNAAHWAAAFGEPQIMEDKTVIPVAQVGYTYGFGFGGQSGKAQPDGSASPLPGDGKSAGGALTKPLGALVVTSEQVRFEGVLDVGRVVVVSCALGALVIYQLAKTLRAIFARE